MTTQPLGEPFGYKLGSPSGYRVHYDGATWDLRIVRETSGNRRVYFTGPDGDEPWRPHIQDGATWEGSHNEALERCKVLAEKYPVGEEK